MDAKEIAEEALRLAEAATPGPWAQTVWYGTEEGGWCGVGPHINDSDDEIDDPDGENCARANRDAALIAHAGTHYATLARAYLELVRDLPHAVLRAARTSIRWWEHSSTCARYEPRPEDSPRECDCGLDAFIAAVDRWWKLEGE